MKNPTGNNGAVMSAAEVMATLSPFQQRTAAYAVERLFADDSTHRFLIADEVGLGKTHVAKAVIAHTVERLQELGDERTDIVYICSNAAIARQNRTKLNIGSSNAIVETDRFTMLGSALSDMNTRRFNLIAITPATSLDLRSSGGTFRERGMLYGLLPAVWGPDTLRGKGPERFFYFGIDDNAGSSRRLRDEAAAYQPDDAFIEQFSSELETVDQERSLIGQPPLLDEFLELVEQYRYRRNYPQHIRHRRAQLIATLRQAAATVGVASLRPDLVILDEFQRFSSVIDPNHLSWENSLARRLFESTDPNTGEPTRTLLLSATPYRPFSTAHDAAGANHYDGLLTTVDFLLGPGDNSEAKSALTQDLRQLRRDLMAIDQDLGEAATASCERVASQLRPIMARTERLASTPDRSGMLRDLTQTVELQADDIAGFLAMDQLAQTLGQRDAVEFWKSGPYLLNFMEGYALQKAIAAALETPAHTSRQSDQSDVGITNNARHVITQLVEDGTALLDWDALRQYETVPLANARLRSLAHDTTDAGLWQLLWLPPALRYYEAGGIFETEAAQSFTKRLVFSGWRFVPKVVSSLLSYEAERHIYTGDQHGSQHDYNDLAGRSQALLQFRGSRTAGVRDSMNMLLLITPFAKLATLTDPLQLAAATRHSPGPPTRNDVERQAARVVETALAPIIQKYAHTGPIDRRWYWAAPALLDFEANPDGTYDWWSRHAWPSAWTGEGQDDVTNEGLLAHVNMVFTFIEHLHEQRDGGESVGKVEPLGQVPSDLVSMLVTAGLGAPGMSALRSFQRVAGDDDNYETTRWAACRIAWGMRSLFNSPEATAIVRNVSAETDYLPAVLDYCVAGNLQAVLDEYIHVLQQQVAPHGSDGIDDDDVVRMVELATNALGLETVTVSVDFPRVAGNRVKVDRHSMRNRFAVSYSSKDQTSDVALNHTQRVSDAFNSPFWPFVLTTTSIGQEGLDFHRYSHAVVHWNLPHNPVDFEQREGRVHRRLGHAVRKNVAHAAGDVVFDKVAEGSALVDPWAIMLRHVATELRQRGEDDDGLQPYWVFAPVGAPARIERHVPVLPLSRGAYRLEQLLRDVATYRMSFGQPRQDELLAFLQGRLSEVELTAIIDKLKVDLSPMSHLTGMVDSH